MLALSKHGELAGVVESAKDGLGSPNILSLPALARSSSEDSSTSLFPSDTYHKSASQLLEQVGILELLQQDERPTFVIDITDTIYSNPRSLNLIFANSALKSRPHLLELVQGIHDDASPPNVLLSASDAFHRWATHATRDGDTEDLAAIPYTYANSTWTYSTLRNRLRVVRSQHPSTMYYSSSTGLDHFHNQAAVQPQLASSPNEGDGPIHICHLGLEPPPVDAVDIISFAHLDPPSSIHDDHDWDHSKIALPSTSCVIDDVEVVLSRRSSFEKAHSRSCSQKSTGSTRSEGQHSASENGVLDWTKAEAGATLPPHVHFIRNSSWAATSLGPIEHWDKDLRAICNLIMASPQPAAIYWGPDLVIIYNEAYVQIAGAQHPALMGRPHAQAGPGPWKGCDTAVRKAYQEGQTTGGDREQLFVEKAGSKREVYFSWSVIPLVGVDGSISGVYHAVLDETRHVVVERQTSCLREIGRKTAVARTMSQFWPLLVQGIKSNQADVPVMLTYSIVEDMDPTGSLKRTTGKPLKTRLVLEGSLGLPADREIVPDTVDYGTGAPGLATHFHSAMRSERPLVVSEKEDGGWSEALAERLQEGSENGEAPSAMVVCPIRSAVAEPALGFLVLGLNPRRQFDHEYEAFVQLLSRQLATSIASVVLCEAEIRRGEKAVQKAAQDHFEMHHQLSVGTHEFKGTDIKYTWMAELAPVGMFVTTALGRVEYCNGSWYKLSSYSNRGSVGDDWLDCVVEEDQEVVSKEWQKVLDENSSLSVEFRFKTPWQDGDGNRLPFTWVLANAHPQKGPTGEVNRIFGSVTNITTQKFAEELQKRRMEEAMELKRQQENFIDTTSHEMRNPLSAILQCADEISMSLTEAKDYLSAKLIDSTVEAAQTISLCAQHQKRIVDDVLTLSKLDSARLLVTPIDVQPASVVQHAIKMFEGEMQNADISFDFQVHPSVSKLAVDWVRLDPSRLLQVLINLTTNAIKFTTTEHRRSISMILGASLSPPSQHENRIVEYISSRDGCKDTTWTSEWGEGEVVYITFAISDSGRGLSDSESKLLFHRSVP